MHFIFAFFHFDVDILIIQVEMSFIRRNNMIEYRFPPRELV